MPKKIKLSIIIPIYNQQAHLADCLNELLRFRSGKYFLEILLIDDGSTDGSAAVCQSYAGRHSQIKYYFQENKGVSAARNLGLRHTAGKYIFFLDADDRLSPGTINYVAEFFDTVYEETDLVTYPIETICQGKRLKPHFRYQYLKKSGVYDLREYPYIGQTTMNIVVKNRFEDNILFDENQTFSEDQKYCCEVLKETLKMGFCEKGTYLYYRSPASASGRLSGACYIFEQCMDFFEKLFAEYEEVPLAFQGLYVNDIYWKMVSNILFPYHYGKEAYGKAIERIQILLKRCANDVIREHPQMDFFEKYYLLRLKGKDTLRCQVSSEAYCLCEGETAVLRERSMEMVITRVFVTNGQIEIDGFLKTVFFQFYEQEPTLCAIENGGRLTRKLKLHRSAHDFYQSRERTQRFWAMRYRCNPNEVKEMHFEAEVGSRWFPVHFYFMPRTPFSHHYKRYAYRKGNIRITLEQPEGRREASDRRNVFRFSVEEQRERKRIWLYYDCKGVAFDNGGLQFEHDIEKQDGVERYYIVTDERQMKHQKRKSCCVRFGSRKHKMLFRRAEKILTAFIEENNVIPFSKEECERYAGEFCFETVYLQHGVLHIDMPWKYSPEKIMADRVVVSTVQEAELFCRNGFSEEELWKFKMPRFDFLKPKEGKKRKILFAPSWREYLVGDQTDNRWELLHGKFLDSVYYKKIQEFLDSGRLDTALLENDYTMEVKLHPIFSGYRGNFSIKSDRIKMVDCVEEESGYDLFVTDFSSFLYDFLYLKIPVISFIPDIVEFRAGMNGYRNLNETDAYWNQVVTEPDMLVERICSFFDGKDLPEFEADFFPGANARENIYQKCISEFL